jgi:hypothetical protein
MAGVQFKQWALEYVLSDEETAQLELARKAARGQSVLPICLIFAKQTVY